MLKPGSTSVGTVVRVATGAPDPPVVAGIPEPGVRCSRGSLGTCASCQCYCTTENNKCRDFHAELHTRKCEPVLYHVFVCVRKSLKFFIGNGGFFLFIRYAYKQSRRLLFIRMRLYRNLNQGVNTWLKKRKQKRREWWGNLWNSS